MGGSFACPECGEGIAVSGLTPGREVICPGCSTLVEVPYLPRAQAKPKRWDRRPSRGGGRGAGRGGMSLAAKRRVRWSLALGAVLAVGVATWWAVGSIGSKARSDRERVLRELIAASDAAQAAGNPGGVFREITAAVIQLRKIDPDGSSRLDALLDRRDQAARAEVQARLRALDQLPVDQGVGEAEILADRAHKDPALATLADEIAAKLEAATRRQVEADRTRAQAALAAGQGIEAFTAASRAYDRAGRLASRADSDRLETEARALIVMAVERFGVAASATEASHAGPSDGFATTLWSEALKARGYLLLPNGSPWGEVWTAHAPYQATCKVVESRDDLYLQSQNRVTRIDGQFALTLRGRPHWQVRVFAQTRSPIPDLPAFLAGKLATANRRDPEIERRLRDDARTAYRVLAGQRFRGIPVPAPASSSS